MKISKNNYTKLLSKYLKHSKLQIALLSVVMLASIAIQLINPQIVSYFIDGITTKKPLKILVSAAIIFISAAFIQQGLAIISTYITQNIGWRATNKLRVDLVKHCLGLDMAFFKEHQSGEIVERIDGDVTALFKFFSELLIKFVNNVLLVIGIIVLLMIKNVIIGFTFAMFLVVSLIVIWKVQQGAVGNFKENREITAKFYGFLGEHIASTEDIKSSGAVKYVMNRFFTALQKWLPVNLKANLSGYKIWMTLEGVFGIGNAMIFALGGYLWYRGHVTIGTVYLMVNYIQLLEKPLSQLREQLQEMQKASASIVRVSELLNVNSKLKLGAGLNIDSNKLELSLDKVCFEYEENDPVLKNITFKLPYGRILGVLGRTGSGKTTLARLIVRFYDIKSGDIEINGIKLSDVAFEELRRNIAYVTQDVQLFNASVRDNITFFNKDIEDEKILKTIYDMGLASWYEKLEDGLNTNISPGGGMSSGEAQLLALVRVFLRNPKLIILDEASSRLDPATEKLVDIALEKLIEERSCIIIAHRLGTVEKADDILILNKGSILEYGSRKELIKNKDSRLNELLNYGMEEVLA